MPPRKKTSASSTANGASNSTATVEAPTADAPVVTKTKSTVKTLELPDFSSKNVWVFELTGIKPAIFKISNDDLRAWHAGEERYKAIRFCDNQDSIWVEDQDGIVKKGFIVFNDGTLEVDKTETTKLEFLFRHPEYNKSFQLLDRDRDARAELQNQELLMEAMNKAMSVKFTELKVVAMAKGFDTTSESVCRIAMMDFARNNPEGFLDAFDNEIIRISAKIREGINTGIISNDGKFLRWQDNQKRILSLPPSVDPIEYAAQQFSNPTETNVAFIKELERRVGM